MDDGRPVAMEFGPTERGEVFDMLNDASPFVLRIFGLSTVAVVLIALVEPTQTPVAVVMTLGLGTAAILPSWRRRRWITKGHDLPASVEISESSLGSTSQGVSLTVEWRACHSWSRTGDILGLWAAERTVIPIVRTQIGTEMEARIMSHLERNGVRERGTTPGVTVRFPLDRAIILIATVGISLVVSGYLSSPEPPATDLRDCGAGRSIRVVGLEPATDDTMVATAMCR